MDRLTDTENRVVGGGVWGRGGMEADRLAGTEQSQGVRTAPGAQSVFLQALRPPGARRTRGTSG